MTEPAVEVSRRGPVRKRIALVVILALAVAVATALWVRDHRRDREWEHGGDGVQVQAQIEATSVAGFGDALAAAGVPPEPGLSTAGQMLVAKVSWSGTPQRDGRYEFILLDNRVTPPKPIRAYAVWAQGDARGPGWAGAYEPLSDHYPWLERTASLHTAQGWTNDTEALGVSATTTGDETLAYWLDKDDLATARPDRDLVLGMVFVDVDGEVRWATKVPLLPAA